MIIERKSMTEKDAIYYLVDVNKIWTHEEINEPSCQFYVKTMVEHNADCIYDIDTYAHLNTLFGYDIGFKAAMQIDSWLWDPDKNGLDDISTIELSFRDKELLIKANEVLNLGLSFDKFRNDDFLCYEYFSN